MGSFDVGCGLSNLTIHYGDRAGFLILDESFRSSYNGHSTTGKAFLSGGSYLPFLPPVFGIYDDYGRIRNIEPSTTTKILEKLFDRPIEVVMNCLTGMSDIYDSYGEIAKTYMLPELRDIDRYDASFEEILIAAGFAQQPEENGYVSFDYDVYTLSLAETTWTIIRKDTDREIAKLHSPSPSNKMDLLDAFGQHTGSYPGFSSSDHGRIRLLNRLGGMFFLGEVFAKMDEFNKADHYMNRFHNGRDPRHQQELDEFFEYLKTHKNKRFPFDGYLPFVEELKRDVSFPMEHWGLLEAYEDNPEEFLSMGRIHRIANSVNRLLTPTYCGEQTGNDRASLMLNLIEAKILDVRKKEYEEEVDDDDDEKYWDLGVEL
jgi:hypothetical protein